jgi:hypothetical protein
MKSLNGQAKTITLRSFQYVLDTLSRPVMSTKYERVFSGTKKLITPERSQLEGTLPCFWLYLPNADMTLTSLASVTETTVQYPRRCQAILSNSNS